jgi:hypothetical protein
MRAAALVMTLVLLPALVAARADDPKKEPQEGKDKKALDVVKEVGALYKGAKSWHVDAEIATATTDGDNKREAGLKAAIDFARPDQFALRSRGRDNKDAGVEVVADGKKLFAYLRRLNEYTEADAPTDLGSLGRGLLRLGPPNVGILMPNVLSDDPYESLMEGVNSCTYAGTDKVNGTPAHHLKFSQDQFDWELWAAAEGKPLVLKIVTTFSAGDGKAVVTETYKNWKLDDTPGKDAFSFSPPDGAKKVEEFSRRAPGGD